MSFVHRDEIIDYQTYEDRRNLIRSRVMEIKQPRRIHLGDNFTFLFENKDTVKYQIQEMMRVERIVRESDIQHEIDTYNGLLSETGELTCTLLIEIADEAERKQKLVEWRGIMEYLYVELPNGKHIPAQYDQGQMNETKLSSVQYVRFPVDGQVPEAIVLSSPKLKVRVTLDSEQKSALAADLKDAVPMK